MLCLADHADRILRNKTISDGGQATHTPPRAIWLQMLLRTATDGCLPLSHLIMPV